MNVVNELCKVVGSDFLPDLFCGQNKNKSKYKNTGTVKFLIYYRVGFPYLESSESSKMDNSIDASNLDVSAEHPTGYSCVNFETWLSLNVQKNLLFKRHWFQQIDLIKHFFRKSNDSARIKLQIQQNQVLEKF